jgi:endonuclease YncB( thermonuclease family)
MCQMGGPLGPDVNREIVRQGWALAQPQMSDAFTAAERDARAAKVGLWTGSFDAPSDGRRARGVDKVAN